MASVTALLVLLLAGALPAYATEYNVGDSQKWQYGVNYDTWVSGKTFKVGDTLLFQYSPSQHDVTEVSQSDYSSCSSTKPIKKYSDGNTSISLTASGSRYFICSFPTHCSSGGMKVAVTVSGSSTPTTPSSPPPTSGAPAPPSPTTSGPSSQPPPPPPQSSGAAGLYGTSALLSSALLVGLALVC